MTLRDSMTPRRCRGNAGGEHSKLRDSSRRGKAAAGFQAGDSPRSDYCARCSVSSQLREEPVSPHSPKKLTRQRAQREAGEGDTTCRPQCSLALAGGAGIAAVAAAAATSDFDNAEEAVHAVGGTTVVGPSELSSYPQRESGELSVSRRRPPTT